MSTSHAELSRFAFLHAYIVAMVGSRFFSGWLRHQHAVGAVASSLLVGMFAAAVLGVWLLAARRLWPRRISRPQPMGGTRLFALLALCGLAPMLADLLCTWIYR